MENNQFRDRTVHRTLFPAVETREAQRKQVLWGVGAAGWLLFGNGLSLLALATDGYLVPAPEDDLARDIQMGLGGAFVVLAAALGFLLWKKASRVAAACLVVWLVGELIFKWQMGAGLWALVFSAAFLLFAVNGLRGAVAFHAPLVEESVGEPSD